MRDILNCKINSYLFLNKLNFTLGFDYSEEKGMDECVPYCYGFIDFGNHGQ